MWGLEEYKYAGIRLLINTVTYTKHSAWNAPDTQPDRVKTYPDFSYLFATRIFISRGHDGEKPLPLIIRAHGGGFIVNNPAVDDDLARYIADHANCIVVSIDYRKSPQNKFPAAYEDVLNQSLAIINDSSLPVDKSKVLLCGTSAGGNLCLGAAQDSRLRSQVIGVAAIMPALELLGDKEAMMATRPDPSIPDFIGDKYDGLRPIYFDAANIPPRSDVRASPASFSKREDLPENMLVVTVEHDMFTDCGKAFAEKLVDLSDGKKTETKAGWHTPGVSYHTIMGQRHAFEAFPAKTPAEEEKRKAAIEELHSTVSDWLVSVFSKSA